MTLLEKYKENQLSRARRLVDASLEPSIRLPHTATDLFKKLKNGEPVFIEQDDNELEQYVFNKNQIAVRLLKVSDESSQKDAFYTELILRLGHIDNKVYLARIDSEPAFNPILIKVCRDRHSIDIENKKPFYNAINLYQDLKESFKDNEELNVENCAEISFPTMHLYNRRYVSHPDDSEPLYRASCNTSRLKSLFHISDSIIYPFALAYEAYANEKVVYALAENRGFHQLFESDALLNSIKDGKSILFACANKEDKENKLRYLKEHGFDKLLSPKDISATDFKLAKVADALCSDESPSLTQEEQKIVSEAFDKTKEYLDSARSQQGMGIIENGEESLTALNKLSFYRSLRHYSFTLDVSNYNPDTFEKDKKFIAKMKTWNGIIDKPLREHPLHSYNANGNSKQVFLALKELLKKTRNDLSRFLSKTEKCHIAEWGENIKNAEDYVSERKLINTILRYDGFPLSFFRISENPLAMPLALRLSSAKEDTDSLFEELCEFVENLNSLSDIPLKKVLEDTHSKNVFVKEKAKRTLKGILRDKRDYQSFTDCLKEYIDTTSELDEILKEGENIFGLAQYSENGPRRLLHALEFVDDYRKIVHEHPHLAKENNPFIEKIFSDVDFRSEERDALRDADLALDVLESDRKSLADFFTDNILGDDIPFDEMAVRLEERNSITYEQYAEYMDFLTEVKNASDQIREGLRAYDLKPLKLSGFENDYWYSLYKALTNQRYENGLPDPYPALKALKRAIPYLEKHQIIEAYKQLKERAQKAWWGSMEAHNERKTERLAPYAYNSQMLGEFWNLILKICPLQILTEEELPIAPGKFDIAIIVDPENFSDEDLASFLARSDSAICLSLDTSIDPRLEGYQHINLDLDTLYRGPLQYENLSDSFIDLFVYGFDENGFELQNQEESDSPMPLSYIGKDGIRRCAIPYALISGRQVETVAIGTNVTLMSLGLSPVVLFPSIALVINPSEQIRITDEKAEDFEKEEK